ncbi:MAG: Efflux transporter periplasmic adaptor subunit [Pseudomonadota bacterium]|jgi:multidrug efflux system membrane fusion protein|nr:Efflux transporter periplasmic adaptor subunit [Pseudomonadota bacterium]
MQRFDQLTSRPKFIAAGLAVLVALWLLSGILGKESDQAATQTATPTTAGTMSVQFQSQVAQPVTRNLSVYGRTTPVRQVELKAETSGRVSELGVRRGALARSGELLLKLDLRDRQARLDQARAGLNQQQAAYEGQLELKPQGYVSETQLAETLAKLEAARAELTRAELDLEYMHIRAPFNGMVQERTVEIGDYVRAGDPVATFVDNTQLIVTGSIAEQDAGFLRVGTLATAHLVTGEVVSGKIRYIAPVADEATRTFTVELELPNPAGKLPAGVTTEMRIPAGVVLAYLVSPSLLTLDAEGELGIKTVAADGKVVFNRISIAQSGSNGIWVSGLPDQADIIVVGQGYVSAGQSVKAIPATAQDATAAGQTAILRP